MLVFFHHVHIFSASTDSTIAVFHSTKKDACTEEQDQREENIFELHGILTGHTVGILAMYCSGDLLITGSMDTSARVVKFSVVINLNEDLGYTCHVLVTHDIYSLVGYWRALKRRFVSCVLFRVLRCNRDYLFKS